MRLPWVCLIVVMAFTACNDPQLGRRGEGAAAFLELDSELGGNEVSSIEQSVQFIADRQIEESRQRWMDEVFGGAGPEALLDFLDQRISIVLSQSTNIEERIRINTSPVRFEPSAFGALASRLEANEEDGASRGATNLSVLWFLQKSIEPDLLQFLVNGRLLSVASTRVGIIQLGPAFLRVPVAVQAGVLLHEARHSDCTGGLWRSDLERIVAGDDPRGLACAHLHVLCPEEHEFAGLYACDAEAWGAYSVNLIYASGLASHCQDCSLQEQVVAEAAAADAATRLLLDVDAMLDGRLGAPDMTSTAQVVDR